MNNNEKTSMYKQIYVYKLENKNENFKNKTLSGNKWAGKLTTTMYNFDWMYKKNCHFARML